LIRSEPPPPQAIPTKKLEAKREKRNWGATPEEEKFETEELKSLAHNVKIVTGNPACRQ